MSEFRLKGKHYVVTGALGSLGYSLSLRLVDAGARVTMVDLAESIEGREPPKGSLLLGGVDLTNEEAVEKTFKVSKAKLGTIDGLINIAGGFSWEPIKGGTLATWDRMYQMNLRSAVVACSVVLPYLSKSNNGAIVNIGAAAAQKAALGMGAYTASKSGVARLTESLAEELKLEKVRVNAVLPSIIDTAANRVNMPDEDFSRWVKVEELCAVIEFLLSDAASAVTGACVPVIGKV
ncbi:MAG: NAD-dependent oxidoreductase [Colwellia sp.]|nr:MAG: NAD-dependent oxidoreductase [Colwellia sp.]